MFPIFIQKKWRNVDGPEELLGALEALTRQNMAGVRAHGPPPPIINYIYQGEGVAVSGPRAGATDDRWLPWWELPRRGRRRVGDCEDLGSAWAARQRLAELDADPMCLETPLGWHAAGFIRCGGGPHEGSPRGPIYTRSFMRGWIVDPSWMAGMRHPAGAWPGWVVYQADPAMYLRGIVQ